jgi:MFS family permease
VGRGPFISCSLLAYILSMLLLARATTAVEFLLGAFAEGAGAGILIPMMTALVADRSLPKERGQAYAVCVGGFDLGIALGGPIAGTLVPLLGYRGVFGVAASLSTLAFVVFVTQTSPTTARSIRFALGRVADEYAREGS